MTDNGDNQLGYTSAVSFSGTDIFNYAATDGMDLSGPANVTVSIQSQAPDSDKPGDPDNPIDLEDPSDTSDPNSGGGCFIGLSYQ